MSKREFTLENEYVYKRSTPVRWLVSHLARYPLLPPLMIAASVLTNYAYGGTQIYVGRAFDLLSQPKWTNSALLALALGMLALTVAEELTGLIRNTCVAFIALRLERDARDELFVSFLGKSQAFHGRQRIGDLLARSTDDMRSLKGMFSPGIMLMTDSFMSLVVPVVLIGRLQPRLLLVPGIFTVLLILTVYDYNVRLQPVSTALRQQHGLMNARLAEAFAGIEVVKANVQEEQEWTEFAMNARAFRDSFVRQGIIEACYWPGLAYTIAWAGCFLHGLTLWNRDIITLGTVLAFMGLFTALREPTFLSVFTFNLAQSGLAGAKRILDMITTETELDENVAGAAQPIKGEVIFDNVTFSYDGKVVLRNISFTAHPGETVAIVGQTGSGKTTLTRLVNRIFDVDSGRVLVDGIDVRAWSLGSLRAQISTIEQDVFLFSQTLAENIAFGVEDASREAVETAAREAQAHDFILDFSDGYETKVGERGVTLSGGQRQRIAIARAFLTDPRILILDDSTSAIDSATEDKIQRAMRRISADRTTLIVTHRLSQIRWADRILVLRRGELVAQGNHDELMSGSDTYRRIFARRERQGG